jgi:1,4-dihydroxy-2-naphthoate octaprenyltransferase
MPESVMFAHHIALLARLARLKFLIYSPVMYTIGAYVAYRGGVAQFDVTSYLLGLAFVYTTHVMTHFFNEFYDRHTDALNVRASPWTGGSRVLPEGRMRPESALWAGRVTMVIALLLAALPPFSHLRVTCGAIVLLSWAYSAPPLALEGRGLGELTVAVVLNGLVPIAGSELQGGSAFDPVLLSAILPLAIIEHVRMMVMNMADIEADRLANKATLVVRIGLERAIKVHRAGMLFAYLTLLPCLFFGLPGVVALCIALTAPFAVWVCKRLAHPTWIEDNPFWSSQHNGLCMLMCLVGFLLEGVRPIRGAALWMLYPLIILSFVLPKMVKTGRELAAAPR